jgi:hypothetical protein
MCAHTWLVRAVALGISFLAALVAMAAASAQAAESRTPMLRIVSDRPFVVVGSGFRSHERVKLLVSASSPLVRSVRAGSLGRFRIALDLVVSHCGGVVVQALGARGTRATVDRAGPDCAPIG